MVFAAAYIFHSTHYLSGVLILLHYTFLLHTYSYKICVLPLFYKPTLFSNDLTSSIVSTALSLFHCLCKVRIC